MLGNGARDARRTERFLDGLLSADERRAADVPADTDLDPEVQLAARRLRSELVRVHPSFRFEEALSSRLSLGAARLCAGLPVEPAETSVHFPAAIALLRRGRASGETADGLDSGVPAFAIPTPGATALATTASSVAVPGAAQNRIGSLSAKPPRPLLVGGVGVASAALSIGAVYVAWRLSHPSLTPMGRAARAAHGSRATDPAGRSRRAAVLQGILGVVS